MSGNCDLIDKDLYKILDCTPDSSTEEIKRAYHRKILETHPDKSRNLLNSSQLFQDIKLAWETLGNPHLRKEYDIKCEQDNLEAESAIIYARLSVADLQPTDDENILSYPCRCGNKYLVERTDLEEINCVFHISCQDCTFVIAIET